MLKSDVASTGPLVALAWELPSKDKQVKQGAKPERRVWSNALYKRVSNHWSKLVQAQDIQTIIPIHLLNEDQAKTLMCELLSIASKYECSWDHTVSARDVNGRFAKKYRATGLFQMNEADDQKNYRTGTKYTHEQLKNPLINIEVAVNIIVTVLDVRGKITFKSNDKSKVLRYFFATLVTDNESGRKVFGEYFARRKKILESWGIQL